MSDHHALKRGEPSPVNSSNDWVLALVERAEEAEQARLAQYQQDKAELHGVIAEAAGWRKRAITAERRRDAARGALLRYGRHDDGCQYRAFDDADCTCGFGATLTAPQEAGQ